jgi:FKBP-type peptidyl-prolyl cis-trans isomerase FkpA
MAAGMKSFSRPLHLLASALILSLSVAPLPASAAPARKGKVAAAAPKQVAVSNTIIPLPLAPIVPAAQRLCTTRAASGLGSTTLRAGSGARPAAADTVLVNYIGYLATTGAVFDQGMRTPLGVSDVIEGFSQGLQTMSRSGIVRLCIPAAMGYGAQASGPIPANSDLVFQIELLDFKTAAEIEAMRKAEAAGPETRKDAAPQP